MTTRRKFLSGAAVAAPAALAAPSIVHAQAPIKWRMQTYAGAALGEQVTKPAVDYINAAANGEMEIELFYADQIVPTGELFQAMQRGTIDMVHSDDDSMASPTPLQQFGGYFPFATKHILDVPVLFNQYGLADIWKEEYAKVGVEWLSAAGQDPCNFNTTKEIKSVADLDGLKLYTFPTAGRFLSKFGVVPVNIPYEDAEVAVERPHLADGLWRRDERVSLTAFIRFAPLDNGGRQERHKPLGQHHRARSRSAATVGGAEGLVEIRMHHVETELAQLCTTQQRIQVRPVAVHDAAGLAYSAADLQYVGVEEAQGAGQCDHHPCQVRSRHLVQRLQVHVAVLV